MNTATDTGRASKGTRLFSLGQVVCTPGAIQALENTGHSASEFLVRHALGDWGDLCAEDKQANDEAIADDLRILSAYRLQDGERIWILTEANRSVTTLLLPEEY
ncbi:hypothetical protein PDESU_02650 [Pontiella desulfatans]|uniref:Plasmid related protein n=1 Tax=Pontiella desulfatans TaxID=2750659 RepID=A0A6C2U2G3_PONDE|nr:hypothetical protein [Pontiella desulfatans]VGO14093.1 hypothetical protein PDESU_02650 [Pontiella desulfatans]